MSNAIHKNEFDIKIKMETVLLYTKNSKNTNKISQLYGIVQSHLQMDKSMHREKCL